jgi:hypothetical protein
MRKYKLHYRAENTQQGEETGVYTLKIRTEQDHQRLKLMRQKHKVNKKKSKGKGGKGGKGGTPAALGLLTASVDATDIRKELGLSIVEWEDLQDSNFAQYLTTVIPQLMTFEALVDECQWFFDQLHEHELSTRFDKVKDQIEEIVDSIAERLAKDETLDRLRDDLHTLQVETQAMYTELRNVSAATVNKFVEISSRPRQAFLEDLTAHWDTLSGVWNDYREVLYPQWVDVVNSFPGRLQELNTSLSIMKEASLNRLVTIQQLLRKNLHLRNAEDLEGLIQAAKEESFSGGHIPAIATTGSAWMVYLDDCPAPEFPTKNTNITDKFAYCKMANDKKCPAYQGVHGENVICSAAGTHRLASFFSLIEELDDQALIDQLKDISKDDPQILALFKVAESRDDKLYYARISDDRITVVLDRYPSSKRVGIHSYTMYHVAGEPLLMTNEVAICADRQLLEDLDKGTPMPKVATVRTSAVMRMTFTSNARMDTNFLDYMRKLNALKLTENTWDVPFKLEADKGRILTELQCDFGYPIQVFQVVESPELFDYRQHDVCAMTIVSQAKIVAASDFDRKPPMLRLSDKLYDIAAQSTGTVASKLQVVAASLRVSDFFVIACADEVYEQDGFIGVNQPVGARVLTEAGRIVELDEDCIRDIKTGEVVEEELAFVAAEAVPHSMVIGSEGVDCVTIKITPEAFSSLMNLLRVPQPSFIPPPQEPMAPPPAMIIPPPPPPPMLVEDNPQDSDGEEEEEEEEEEETEELDEEEDDNSSEEEAPPDGGTFVTFSPVDGGPMGMGRPKIRFLTPDVASPSKKSE